MNLINGIKDIKAKLTKRRKKRGTIVKEEQMKSYCRELGLDFTETTLALLNKRIIAKYSKNGKGYPYRFVW
jgi:hypothetical protein